MRHFRMPLSIRISLTMVCAIAVLLLACMIIVLGYSRKAIRNDSFLNASETLEYTIQNIDNVLFSVEQSAGNMYFELLTHIDDPDKMHVYSRKMVELNPYIMGCAIAMEPGFYKDRPSFMAYYHRASGAEGDTVIVSSDSFADSPYYTQLWYTRPMETGRLYWIDPIENADDEQEAVTTFSLPIYNRERRVVGVMGVDVSIVLLSRIVEKAKPTPHSYAVLMGSRNFFLVYPDSSQLFNQGQSVRRYQQADTTVKEVMQAMAAGESGYRRIRKDDGYSYVFFKPYRQTAAAGRAIQDLGWSTAIIFPEDDLKGDYKRMHNVSIFMAFGGLLLLFVLYWFILHRQLHPLRLLTRSAKRIADGHYDETIPDSDHQDEVGMLQKNFRNMQLSLSDRINELHQLTDTLQERGKVLEEAYEQAKEGERVKSALLHNMTNQMLAPVSTINNNVEALCNNYQELDQETTMHLATDIQQQSKIVIELLDDLLHSVEHKVPSQTESHQ